MANISSSLFPQNEQNEIGVDAVSKLLESVDEHIPEPKRDLEQPFYLPIEQMFVISGQCLETRVIRMILVINSENLKLGNKITGSDNPEVQILL